MNLEKDIKTLFLITQSEKISFPKELLKKNVVNKVNIDAIIDIMNFNCDQLIVTRGFMNQLTKRERETLVCNIHIFTPIKMIYLTDIVDDVEIKMREYGNGNIYDIDVYRITLKVLTEIENKFIVANEENLIIEEEEQEIKLDAILSDIEVSDRNSIKDLMVKHNTHIVELLYSYKKLKDNVKDIINEKDKLKNLTDIYNKNLDSLLDEIKEKDEIIAKYKTDLANLRLSIAMKMDQINQYNEYLEGSVLEGGVLTVSHDYLPKILYFKEFEDIGMLDYIDNLHFLFKNMFKKNVKIVILENSIKNYYDRYSSYGYSVLGLNPNMSEIIGIDKIVHYGNSKKLLKILTKPEMRLDGLIIYDKTGDGEIHLQAPTLIPYYIGVTRSHLPILEISDESFISEYEGNYMEIKPLLTRIQFNNRIKTQYQVAVGMNQLTLDITELMGFNSEF